MKRVLACVLVATAFIGACAEEEPTATTSELTPDPFWEVFLAGDIDALPQAQAHLLAERKRTPDEASVPLVLGMSYVWANAENERTDRKSPPLAFPDLIKNAQGALTQLTALTKLTPEEPRAWAHLGTVMVTLGLASANESMVDQGRTYVEEHTLPLEKAETGFALGAAFSQAPAGSDSFARSIDYLFMAYEDCLGRKLDREAPDLEEGYEARRTSERPRDVCFNQDHWPHAEEGNLLVFGDALMKAGKPEAAKRAYAAAKKVPTYTTWKYKDVLEARSTTTAPPAVGAAPANCGQCHTR